MQKQMKRGNIVEQVRTLEDGRLEITSMLHVYMHMLKPVCQEDVESLFDRDADDEFFKKPLFTLKQVEYHRESKAVPAKPIVMSRKDAVWFLEHLKDMLSEVGSTYALGEVIESTLLTLREEWGRALPYDEWPEHQHLDDNDLEPLDAETLGQIVTRWTGEIDRWSRERKYSSVAIMEWIKLKLHELRNVEGVPI